jgi:hypothetical protein
VDEGKGNERTLRESEQGVPLEAPERRSSRKLAKGTDSPGRSRRPSYAVAIVEGKLSQEEIAEYFTSEDDRIPGNRGALTAWWLVNGPALSNWWRRQPPLERLLHVAAYLALPVTAAATVGLSALSVVAIAVLVTMQARKAWAAYRPGHLHIVHRNQLAKKIALRCLVDDLQRNREMGHAEVRRFQEEALDFIARSVRDRRSDLEGSAIYANLLVENGEYMMVIARNESHRILPGRYPKENLLAWRALESGRPKLLGDLGETEANPLYRSILALPVTWRGIPVGVVTVDSQLSHHFDRDFQSLTDELNPFVAMLAWTLTDEPVRRDGIRVVRGGDA